jgi:hypothetical protein
MTPQHRWWDVGVCRPGLLDHLRSGRDCLFLLMIGCTGETRRRFELVDGSAQDLVHEAAHVIGRENETALLVDEVAPLECVVPDISERVLQQPRERCR